MSAFGVAAEGAALALRGRVGWASRGGSGALASLCLVRVRVRVGVRVRVRVRVKVRVEGEI